MIEIRRLPEFDAWLGSLKDILSQARLVARLRKVSFGNFGDVNQVREGVWEMREFFGPGWCMYYIQRGDVVVIMLGGGDKATQQRDIAKAIQLVKTVED